MNIFVLHKDPQKAASMACDRHVVKMILETAQMMCTVVASYGHTLLIGPRTLNTRVLFGPPNPELIGIG